MSRWVACLAPFVFAACAQGSEADVPARDASGADVDDVSTGDAIAETAVDADLDSTEETSIDAAETAPKDDGAIDGETNPCVGVTCDKPPATTCADAGNLKVYSASGTCEGGACTYSASTIPCALGCESGACKGDPCAGKTCTMPPADYCASPTKLVKSTAPGTCSAGTCTYPSTDVACPCSAGKCLECVVDTDCASGKWCSANVCTTCNTDAKCGASCVACSGTTPKCLATGSPACVECIADANCTGGKTCDLATHTCKIGTCPTTLTSAFSDDFATPASATWSSGTNTALGTSRWHVYTTANHGVRINGGTMQITNARSSSPDHGHGYAYVKTGGTGSNYDNAIFNPTLKSNASSSVVWTFNMRRDDPEATNGGFKCSSTSSQNYITIGLSYVLATNAADALNASTSTCSSSATGHGYAVVLGGSNKIRLVKFTGGLRNGTLTDLVSATGYSVSNYFSVRVTYNATSDLWTLDVRNDGASAFTSPTGGGAYGFTGTATDATYVTEELDYSGPYFQTGCTGLCSSTMSTWFDNVNVGVRCAP